MIQLYMIQLYMIQLSSWYKIDILLSRVTRRPGHGTHTYTKHSFGIFSVQVKRMANFLHENKEEKNWVLHCFCLLLRVRWYADIHTYICIICICGHISPKFFRVICGHIWICHTCNVPYILFSFVEYCSLARAPFI